MDWQHEVWAEALWVEQHKGNEGPAFIADQVARLALANDLDGVARWKRISTAYDELRAGRRQ
ncbi:hypothetical protein [Novosphingobium sp. Gsoil 351]|uniref:DUF6961 family protein n=1 Tax=Novosphingobium sp. Gsoil 351 TaxID=2675225 RepID=UPI0012B48C2D|nr:hypothetical protein [Novosphingobium sp. Gsoil 351]QGN54968.1 hypothetical protein GKE62_10790 [Novosphingobium sp. Gsoil 351]